MKTIGNYEVLAEVAQGGMGAIYRARDPHLGRDVAIKVIRAGIQGSERHRKRFEREAKALAKLRHPGVVSVHVVGEHEGAPYLVMDWVEGESLQARIDRAGPLPPPLAAEVVRRLAETLAYTHSEGVLHRDLKPENVLITTEGHLRLTDFGLSKDLNATSTGTQLSLAGAYLGTPGYWPPEQALGKLSEVGPHSDVYALGATLYALLTGQPPFVAGCKNIPEVIRRMSQGPPRAPSELRAGIDPGLEALCLRSMAQEPRERPSTAAELAAALEPFAKGEAGAAPVLEPAPEGADPFARTAVQTHFDAGSDSGLGAAPSAGGSGVAGRAAPSQRSFLLLAVVLPAILGVLVALWARLDTTQQELLASKVALQELEGQAIASAVERDEARRRIAELGLEVERLEGLGKTREAKRAEAEEALEGFVRSLADAGPEAIPVLERALDDQRPSIRQAACLALGAIADERARVVLRRIATEHSDEAVRATARSLLE